MTGLPPLRLLPAFAGALGLTLAIFLFMQGLIQRSGDGSLRLPVYEQVEILPRQPEPDVQEEQPQPEDAPAAEPQMEALQVAAPAPQLATEPQMPDFDPGAIDIDFQPVGSSFSAPGGAAGVNIPGNGQDANGFVEVVPYNTRRPNVPEVAWENRISGWVLVAFTVTPRGETRDVRVLDANPRGVFEDKVIAAVEDWHYSVNFSRQSASNVVLTQKVEVRWQDYPNNLPNVD
ncbi:TonB family protein [Seongchinamella sediminis]|uniref:Protein TonB n=1 Tax=Seongchinamella sediminis TaxID=2283635 RepID=A0A3L7E1I7_9GAMM|nr:TonB family protein [Seongchinamella sediminis]RLQ22849.1 TonB family protein [Seongchinamella sediminis]